MNRQMTIPAQEGQALSAYFFRTTGAFGRVGKSHAANLLSSLATKASPPSVYRLLYGLWLGGLSEMPFSVAFCWTAAGVRPSLKPMTRVGVFCLAMARKRVTSGEDQFLPVFLVLFDIKILSKNMIEIFIQ